MLCIIFEPIIRTLQFDDTHVLKVVMNSLLLLQLKDLSIHPIEHSSLDFIVTSPNFSFGI